MDAPTDNGNDSSVPVPKPRRNLVLGYSPQKTSYENVSIDLINKNIDIKNENLQNNSKNKIPLNKAFMLPASPPPQPVTTVASSVAPGPGNVLTELNDLQSSSKDVNRNLASTLDEVNKLSNIYSDDENLKHRPVPAPRRSNAGSLERDANLVSPSTSLSTGAISKLSNKSMYPSLDGVKKSKSSGSYSFVSDEASPSSCASIDGGKKSKYAGSYSLMSDETDSADFGPPPKYTLNKNASMSNSSLASTQSGSSNTEGSPGSKYHTTSPGRLLKALGATSKLLTESITERVTTRTKDAKHKIDKIHKNSRDRLVETSKFASNKIKSVRKNIHSTIEMTQNLSLGRSHKKAAFTKNNDGSTSSSSGGGRMDSKSDPGADRPQTVPANDDLFQSIKFNSPLISKTNHCMNINTAESSYEIPKSIRSTISSDSCETPPDANSASLSAAKKTAVQPPSYDEIMKADSAASSSDTGKVADSARPLPIARTRSKNVVSSSYENHEIVKMATQVSRSDSSSSENATEYSTPCPSFPAPVLSEGIYGKLRCQANDIANNVNEASPSIQAPTRSKRRKDYEATELRVKLNEAMSAAASNRATADSNEFIGGSQLPALFARDVSDDFTEKLRLAEKSIPSPDRSDSWSYYETNSDELSSTPEPIYANDCNEQVSVSPTSEPLYGVLYNADTTDDGAMLVPKAVERKRRSARLSDQYAKIDKSNKEANQARSNGAAGGDCAPDVLKEFDPLDRKTFDKVFTNKSNELILLENLLGEETYGTCADDSNFAYTSLETSEDDDDINELPAPPERLDSLPEGENEGVPEATCRNAVQSTQNDEYRKTVIVHQNFKLHSGSSENIVDQVNVSAACTSSASATSTDEDSGRATKSRWFHLSSFDGDSKSKGDQKAKDEKATSDSGEEKPSVKQSMMSSMFSNVKNKMEGIKRKTSFRTASPKVEVKTILEMVPRPCLTQRLTLHEGHLIRLPNRQDILKDLHSRKAYIRDRKFQAYFDKDMKQPKENIPLEWITTIQCVNNQKGSNNLLDIYSFEITTAIPKNVGESLTNPNIILTSTNSGNTKTQRLCHIYGVAKESERFIWMQKLLESITEVFPPGFSCRFHRAGWCYSKNSITSKWSGAWILLQKEKRRLLFHNYLDMNLECMDLRKARCLVLKESDDSINNLHVESGPTLMIDCPPYAMYFIMASPRETKIWRHIIQEVAHNNGPTLKEQQLTKDNVPVLVDKCINFIYAHGSMSEGIYRKSGSENSIQKLLKVFRTDAFSAQIIRSDFNEHDVANALKRFMRDLPDRLLGKFTVSLISVSEMKDVREKINAYKELLSRLPTIEYHTLRKLLGHLHFIQTQKEHNKMDVANLSIVWGPTLLQDKQCENHYSQTEADVLIDLIKYYKNLYALSAEEVAKEQIMLQVLQKYHAAAENLNDTMKKSGDLKVWITIDASPDDKTEEKPQINVTLTPNKTVNDICKELAPHMKREAFALTLSEIVLNETLHRPLHHSEKVFDIVLKWSYWPEADRKNNYLRLRPTKFMKEVERALEKLPTVSLNKELKFADCKTKSFKLYTLELNDGKMTVLKKEKNTIVKVREIDLTKATAYLGCEKKRDFQLRWAITLIEDDSTNKSNLRTRESPFIGHVIAGADANDQIVWFSSILHSLYGDDIMPSPEIIIQ